MNVDLKQEELALFIDGEWRKQPEVDPVFDKYTGEAIAYVSTCSKDDVRHAITSAKEAQKHDFAPYDRYLVLKEVSEQLKANQEAFALLLAAEVGKPITEARGEVGRAALTLEISAEEAKRIHGMGVPIEAAPDSPNRQAFTRRVPVGVIAAITPFNVPLNLVCHKVGPGLAAGNSVILKPAETTPLSALRLAELFRQAGLPKGRLNVITGDGPSIGDWLLESEAVKMVTFTGSPKVGKLLREKAGLRKVALELGNNSATIVHADAHLDVAANLVAQKSFNNAGQVCISVQRVFVHETVFTSFLEKLVSSTEGLVVGDPKNEETQVGPMIAEREAVRIESWVNEAVKEGAKVELGGKRDGALFTPTILTRVKETMKVCREEVFGPVVSVLPYSTEEEVIEKVNQSRYGLQAGLFTNSLSFAMKAAEQIEVGGLIVNDTSGYRVDQMPYGGVKQSGTGKEGPRYAIEEMTEERLVVLNL